jgi:hypothetical protein
LRVAERVLDLDGARTQDMMSDSVATTAGSHGPASPPRRGWPSLATPLRSHGPAAAVGLALGLLALGPGVARGFLLSYDMVFVPDEPFSRALVGFNGGPARAVPSDAVIAVASRLLPADVLQKLTLLLIFVMACAGAGALLAAGWRASRGNCAPRLACLVSGIFYSWNPFVAERLLIGQWALLLGYAGLPWVLREVCTGPVRIRRCRLVLLMLPAAIGGFAALLVTGLALVPASVARGSGAERCRRLVVVVAALALLSLPWLIPSILVPVHADPMGADLFAARADTPFGRLGSLVMLSGIWNSQTVPRGYGGAGSVFWLLVVACAVACYVVLARRQRGWTGLGLAGVLGLCIAAIGVTPATRAILHDLIVAWPGFAVLRDGQQFVAALALAEAIGLGAGASWLLGRAGTSPGRGTRQRPDRLRPEPAAVALVVLAMLAPVVLLPGLAWGLAGRLRPVQYPDDWLAARQIIDTSTQRGSVLLLPWAAYRRYPWNDGEAVYDPWNKLVSREVISNDGLEVGNRTLTQESAASIRLNRIVSATGPLTGALRAAGVRYVVVDAGPLLAAPPAGRSAQASLAAHARLPGAEVVLASRDLVVFLLPGAR